MGTAKPSLWVQVKILIVCVENVHHTILFQTFKAFKSVPNRDRYY